MADRRSGNVPNSSANLLFSTAPEFNFNLPFIPVSQATGPAVLSGDDSTDVGEEDSFLGQTSTTAAPQHSTLSYFSSSSSGSDPFASIGHQPFPPPVSSSAGPAPVSGPPVSQFGGTVYQNPVGRSTPPPSAGTPPPPQATPQPFNPYRHTPTSSRASPYIPAPEVQQTMSPHNYNAYAQPPPMVPASLLFQPPPPPAQHPVPPAASTMTGPVVPANPMMPYTYNVYEPVQPHWFYCKQVEAKSVWLPFSIFDSLQLEETFNSVQPDPENVVLNTDGGRYDVQLYDRMRTAVYWEEEPTEVRRCTWFYKGDSDSRFIPYSEEFSEKLEAEYKKAVSTNQWHRRLEFPSGETIVMHNPKVIVQFQPSAMPDEWGTTQDGQTRPRVVKRGIDDEHDVPDVDDFRAVSLKLLQSHYKKALDDHTISRVEFLPVQWHTALHGDATGVDRRIKKITLPSTGRLRHFTNETLLDVLFYNSPTYCQTIVDTVASEINRLYALFMQRNPDFRGAVSVSGHSLGSLILFDLLSNQKTGFSPSCLPTANGINPSDVKQGNNVVSQPPVEPESKEDGEEFSDLSALLEHLALSEYQSIFELEKIDVESLMMCTVDDLKEMGIPLGPRKKFAKFVKERANKQVSERFLWPLPSKLVPRFALCPFLKCAFHWYRKCFVLQVSVVYHTLDFEPVNFFALGSPIGMFLTVRGLESIEENYQLPTCKGFFNIYHPLDPVAYRIEPMIMPELDIAPVLIPHHKGRKRLHLELKESLSRMGSDLKQGFISSLKSAWQTLNEFARAHTSSAQLQAQLAIVANQIQEEEKKREDEDEENKMVECSEVQKEEDPPVKIGMLNGGRRIDYVLQEKPIESFNEYLFALQSHLCYWESEDTALLILKEIYKTMGIYPEQMVH
uniref:SEC23-interacting protein n=1 Tax=Denticeps clupeoides TaxID=299321 RepID=A0AAY4C9D4_9TELE